MKTERTRLDLCSGDDNGKWTLVYGLVSLRSSQILRIDQLLKLNLMLKKHLLNLLFQH
jgi:hypothetical protein